MRQLATQSMRALAALGIVLALAWSAGGAAEAQSTQDIIKQVKLTDALVEGFIGAQKDMAAMAEKMQGATPDKPDPKVQAELETIAKKHGFKDFIEYDDVAANISMVMAGIDPQTGNFIDPVTAIKKEIDELEKDTKIAEKDKKQMLEELREALKSTPPLQFAKNIEVVKKYRAKIDAALQ